MHKAASVKNLVAITDGRLRHQWRAVGGRRRGGDGRGIRSHHRDGQPIPYTINAVPYHVHIKRGFSRPFTSLIDQPPHL
jgi:hypothetical protein